MSCNCNNGETPEYYITLDGVGADGYSPEINIVQEDTSSFKLNLINKNNEQITPAIPKLEYLNDTFVTNNALNTTLENYSTTVEMNTALNLKLNKDGSNATNPITLNNFRVQSVGTGTRVGSEGQLTLYGSTARPAYIPQGDTAKTLALFSDVTTKLNADGSNATNPATINGHTFKSLYQGYETHLTMSGAPAYIEAPSLILRGTDYNGKVYYGSSGPDTEIATKGDIKNSTITFTQGGVVKGSFTLNQSTDATIALDAGGGSVSGNRIQLITEDGTRGISFGINNTTKEAFMTYDIIGGISFDLNLISGKTAPITLTKNSDGTYGIGLDYDNDTLKVNQNGQLYADIEAPTYTAGTGIDIDNEEISVDSDYIEAHKAYLADGDTLTDPQGLEDVKYYNQSSFDRSKFTVVGTPTITDDGIASGFSSSNYLTLPVTSNDIKLGTTIFLSFTTNSVLTQQWLIDYTTLTGVSLEIINSKLRIRYYKTSSSYDTPPGTNNLQNNTTYIVRLEYYKEDTTYKVDVYLSSDNGATWVKEIAHTSSSALYAANANMTLGGASGTSAPMQGSIDLKQFSITVDGVEVFSGNKTGIDTIKPDDYTVVGTPTISDDGVASGFSSSNYIDTGYTLPASCTSYKEIIEFTTGSDVTTNQILRGSNTNASASASSNTNNFYIDTGYLRCRQTTTGNSWDLSFNTDLPVMANSHYALTIEWNGTSYIYTLIKDNAIVATKTLINSNFYIQNTLYLGNSVWFTLSRPFASGSIDLNAFKIYVDGNLVYQPCLKVPYALSKTGSKIVDSQYRDRVQDAYNDQGYAPYYTLDETNSNFTLPMGEIYGYITRLEGIVKDLQTRLTALESNINGGGAGVVQQGLLGMSPLSLNRPQLLGELNPIDGLDTMDIQPTEDEITPATISEDELEGEITQEEVEPQPIEEEVAQEEVQEEPQETENEGGENE